MLVMRYKILDFRKHYLLLFITIWSNSFSQMQTESYEFNWYYEKDFVVNKILTNDENFITRYKLKIKTITHKTIINGLSLDSIYLKYPNDFKNNILSISKYHFSNNAYYQYDSTGILNSYKWYPTTNYLTKIDSIVIDKRVGNSTKLYLRDFKRSKLSSICNYASLDNLETSKEKHSIIEYYDNKNRVSEIKTFNKVPEIFTYKKNKTKISTYQYDSIDKKKTYFENTMLFNNKKQLVESKFELNGVMKFSPVIYEITYDSLDNVIECTRKYGENGNKKMIYKFENTYINGILSKVVCTSVWHPTKKIFLLNELGMITSIENEGYTEHFEYQYY